MNKRPEGSTVAVIIIMAAAGGSVLIWRIIQTLSADAMAVGVVFGLLAGVPTALLVLAGRNQADRAHHSPQERRIDSYQPKNRLPSPDEPRETSNAYPTDTIQDSIDGWWDAVDAQKARSAGETSR